MADYWPNVNTVPPPPASPTSPLDIPPTTPAAPKRLPPFPFAPASATGLFIDMLRRWYSKAGDALPDGFPSLIDMTRQIRRTGVAPSVLSAMRDELSRVDRSDLRIDATSTRGNMLARRRMTGIIIPNLPT